MTEIVPFRHNANIRKHKNNLEWVIQCDCGWRGVDLTPAACRRQWKKHPFRSVDTWGKLKVYD